MAAEWGTPDCAAQIIATVRGISRKVLGSPALVRSAFTDPMEELRKAKERSEKFTTAEISVAGEALSSGYAAFNGEAGHHGAVSPSASPVATAAAPKVDISAELLEEMKQQILLKESLESALRQKLEYMDLQLRQKEQENQYFKAQLDCVREEMKTVKEQQASQTAGPELVQQLKRTEEALSLERTSAVAQAKALAEAHVQLKRLQERPTNESLLRAQQEETVSQLRGELRRMEEERNSARIGMANQALQMSGLSEQQAELQNALNAAHAEIKRQKELLEAEPSTRREQEAASPTPRDAVDSSRSLGATSKLSHSELQVLRTHMQSAVRRALEGAGEQGDYQQRLQELDEKLVELSPTRLKMRSGSGTVREVEEQFAQFTPQVSPRIQANGAASNAFGMEETIVSPEAQAPLRLSPLRRPSNMSPEAFPQGISSAGDMYVRPASVRLSATHSGSVTLPQPAAETRSTSGGSGRLATPSSWQPGSSLQAPSVMPRSMEVLPAAQMAANAMAATNAWRPNWLNPKAFQTLPREPFPRG